MASNFPGNDPNQPGGYTPPPPGYPPAGMTPQPGTTRPIEPAPTTDGYIARVRNLVMQPKREWLSIAAEPMTVPGIMTRWVLPFAAISPVASFIGQQVLGVSAFGVTYHPSLTASLAQAVVQYATAVAVVYLGSLAVNWLAPQHGGTADPVAALKAVAFGMIPGFLAGIFGIVPVLGILSIVGLYTLYVLWIGLPVAMRTPPDRSPTFQALSIGAIIVIGLVIGLVASRITAAFAYQAAGSITLG